MATRQEQSPGTRQPTTSVLRSAIFYQNRIVIPDRKTSLQTRKTGVCVLNQPVTPGGTQGKQSNIQPRASNNDLASGGGIALSGEHDTVDYDRRVVDRARSGGRSTDGMSSHGVDIVVTDTDEPEQAENELSPSCCKRFYLCLQDNRMKGNPDAEKILASSNPEDFKMLKKVLNISFLTIGIALLVAVIFVILYTTIECPNMVTGG